MDQRPIGVFDSGLGGLTAVRRLRQIMPSEHIIYFGDTSRVPYGNRSSDTILKYARQDLRFLRSFDLKAALIACGTVSSNCLGQLQRENDIPIIGVVEPTVRRALELTENKRVGLIATRASVSSGAYQRLMSQLDEKVEVFSQPCPLFVPLVEEGRFRRGDVVIETVAGEYLQPLREAGVDTLVMGCTHYPLLEDVIGSIMGENVNLIDAGCESAYAIRRHLKHSDALAPEGQKGAAEFYASDRVADFERLAAVFLHEDIGHTAHQIDIETY